MKTVKRALHHDDSPCSDKLFDGYCKACGFHPDMQSTCFYTYCVHCDVVLERLLKPEGGFENGKLVCPSCFTLFDVDTMKVEE